MYGLGWHKYNMNTRMPTPKYNIFLEEYYKLINSVLVSVEVRIDIDIEKHHILPRSMGGSDSVDNLVELTLKQHYEAHYLLWKAYRNSQMTCAFHLMSWNKTDRRRLTADEYQLLKEDYKKIKKEYWDSLSELEMNLHKEKSNPWKNKTAEEKLQYKQKCNSWTNKTIDQIKEIKDKKSETWKKKINDGYIAPQKTKSIKQKEERNQKFKNTMTNRSEKEKLERLDKLSQISNGTIWINDGIKNKRVKDFNSTPEGWNKGRLLGRKL